MTLQNVFLINYNSLYEILDEIKENLSFNVTNFKNENDFLKKANLDVNKILIISKDQNKLKINKNITDKNLIEFNNLPLRLNKFIELINLKLIKLKFNNQSKIDIKNYELNLNSKLFSKGVISLKLTEKEIEIILYLNRNNNKHSVIDLQKNIWRYSSDIETHTVETHIYRLRKKISIKFKDENFILSHKNGYFIM